jgi:hypothetical protein
VDEVGAVVYSFPDLVLERFLWVGCGCLKIVLVNEILYFVIILVYG